MNFRKLFDAAEEMIKSIKKWIDVEQPSKTFFVLVAVLFCVLVVARRPDVVLNPQFYAEDGAFWYSESYSFENPSEALLIPKQGYFQTISRIGAWVSLMVSMDQAPLVLNFFAIIIQALPAVFFISSRFENIVPKRSHRFFIALLYILLPATSETHGNITNAQWRLALLAFLVIVAGPAKSVSWKIFDIGALALSGLSGPFIFFWFPILVFFSYISGFRNRLMEIGVSSITLLIQLYSFFFLTILSTARSTAPLGASISDFFQLVAGKVMIAGVFGLSVYGDVKHLELWENGVVPVLLIIALVVIGVRVFCHGPMVLRLFVIYSGLIFCAGLIVPQVVPDGNQWDVMLRSSMAGNRYFFFPILAFAVSLWWTWVVMRGTRIKVIVGIILMACFLSGILRDFSFNSYKNYHFSEQVLEFEKIPVGESFVFHIPPGWEMHLVKR